MLIANTATTTNLNQVASKERPLLRNSFPVQDCMQGQTGLLERETGFEPATPCLEGRHSTAELLPLTSSIFRRRLVRQWLGCAWSAKLAALAFIGSDTDPVDREHQLMDVLYTDLREAPGVLLE